MSDWKPRDRFLYLNGELTDEQTADIVARVTQNWGREFLLIINSDGGSSFNAVCLTNLMKAHGRIDTLCVGVAMSGAADCLAAGRRRYIIPGSVAMLHQVSWELGREYAANLVKNAAFLQRLNGAMAERLAAHTNRDLVSLERDLATDFYLFDREIIEYGLADDYWDPAILRVPPEPRRQRLRGDLTETPRRTAPRRDEDKGSA